MADQNRITIVINADGTAAIEGVEKVTGSMKKMETETGSVVDKIKGHWIAVTAAIYASVSLIEKAWGLAEKAAAFEEQKSSLNSLAATYNTTANSIISDIQRTSNGLISMADAVDIAAPALIKGLNPDQINKLAEAAETLSNVTGQKVAVEFRNMSEAIALGRERALEMSVGIIDLNARYGDQVLKMNDAEKAAARYQIVMEKVKTIQDGLGESTDSLSDKMDRFKIQIEDIKLKTGELIVRVAAGFMAVVDGFIMAVNQIAADILRPFAWIEEQLSKVGLGSTVWRTMLRDQQALVQYYEGSAKENFNLMIAQSAELFGVKGSGRGGAPGANGAQGKGGTVNVGQGTTGAEGNAKLTEWKNTFNTLTNYRREFQNTEIVETQNHNNKIRQMDFETAQSKIQFAADSAQQVTGILSMIASGMDVRNKEDFEKQQMLQFNIAGMNTAAGISRAFADYSWPYNFIVAAIVGAAGFTQQMNIMSRQYNSMGSPIGFTGGGGSARPVAATQAAPAVGKSQPITIHVYGNIVDHDQFARELIPAIKKAQADGV